MEQCIGREDNLPDGDEERLGELLDQFLKGVPVQKRNMFIQRYWYSEPIRTIAQLQGKSESTVKVTLHRMRKELKLFLRIMMLSYELRGCVEATEWRYLWIRISCLIQ